MSNPDEILAEKIISKISDKKIIPESLFIRYKDKLAQGMTPEDWVILSESKDIEKGK